MFGAANKRPPDDALRTFTRSVFLIRQPCLAYAIFRCFPHVKRVRDRSRCHPCHPEQRGELATVVELFRHFPGITDTVRALECTPTSPSRCARRLTPRKPHLIKDALGR